eukprot:gnl/TRDRNA2_/TRDRNA2_126176_c0_seq1.p1 gnl/TRDRNA2_/TRDRNA2_126176_c0~~gnl/TRDRNA2_/TRDRNA2_126176_c0_seq1.p1  ORF type:complete len:245 (+),score=34.11 gnl/TRDRNA2_/TRDRNA2_126176_c0_seq1:171-905(+)
MALPSKGYAIAQIEHRGSLEDGGKFPGGLHDVKAAVRWVRRFATSAESGLDPDRIGVWGASSGGYFASMLGVTSSPNMPSINGMDAAALEGSIGEHTSVSSAVCCVVSYYGPSDFLQMDAHSERDKGHNLIHDAPNSPEGCFMGFPIQQNPTAVQCANPAAYVSSGVPPMLIVHGDEDKLVPHHQSRLLAAALEAVGAAHCTLHIVHGGGHGDRAFAFDTKLPALVNDFLERHLKHTGSTTLDA